MTIRRPLIDTVRSPHPPAWLVATLKPVMTSPVPGPAGRLIPGMAVLRFRGRSSGRGYVGAAIRAVMDAGTSPRLLDLWIALGHRPTDAEPAAARDSIVIQPPATS